MSKNSSRDMRHIPGKDPDRRKKVKHNKFSSGSPKGVQSENATRATKRRARSRRKSPPDDFLDELLEDEILDELDDEGIPPL
jgi:hypothetical protein